MKERILVVSPHPDDETLGAGASLLKWKELGAEIFWLNMTAIYEKAGWSKDQVSARQQEIKQVYEGYGFSDFFDLGIPAATLDSYPFNQTVEKISAVYKKVQPSIVILPHPDDAHTDHVYTFRSAFSCTKVFRSPSIKTILSSEVISETDFSPFGGFIPNCFIDVSSYLDRKIEIMKIYKSELGKHPFPRSEEAIRAQALLRGVQAGSLYAEAFQLIKHIC